MNLRDWWFDFDRNLGEVNRFFEESGKKSRTAAKQQWGFHTKHYDFRIFRNQTKK